MIKNDVFKGCEAPKEAANSLSTYDYLLWKKKKKKRETISRKHALLDRTFRGECYNEFVPGLPP